MTLKIDEYLQAGKRAHLVGIGGVSMAPLGEVLHGTGIIISGSDMRESDVTRYLTGLGMQVAMGHLPQSVEGADCVIRTAAVHDDNPEIAAARALDIPVFERSEAWGAIMRQYDNALCVSGTHGKTTTTAMCTHIFFAAHRDPTVMLGGVLPIMGAGHRVGKGDTIILESCEYCNSFLNFFPTVAVILNVDADHLDFFKDLEDVQQSFGNFASLVPHTGFVIANGDDHKTMQAMANVSHPVTTFGMEHGDVHTENMEWQNGFPRFDIVHQGKQFAHVELRVPGAHNVMNALAAASAAIALGVPATAVEEGLGAFLGAGRRFEEKGEYHGAKVYDDYAHHPHELTALLSTTASMGYNRVICAFQPHTYTRTKEFFHEFAESLKLADHVLLAEIYAARETDTLGVSSEQLAELIPDAEYCTDLQAVTTRLAELAQAGDLILTVGAGDIYLAGEALVKY